MRNDVFNRFLDVPYGVQTMSGFIDYELVKDLKQARSDGIIGDRGIENEEEQCHVSELARRMIALDDEETYTTIRAFVKHRSKLLVKILEYMNKKEGEKR